MRTILLYLLIAVSASGQNLIMKDGQVIASKAVRRQGDSIMVTVELSASQSGQPAHTGEVGYPIERIAKIDFPKPAQLGEASDLIVRGNAAEALSRLEPVYRYFSGFRDAPGSWWPDVALLKVEVLVNLGRFDEAERLASEIARTATDPETQRAAQTDVAAGLARRGDLAKALEIYDAVIRDGTRPQTIATAEVGKGQVHLARKEWEQALLSFLEVPVFYPEQKVLMPRVLLGCGRAYMAREDFERAKASLNELTADFKATSEAARAKADLEKIARIEKSREQAR